MVGHLQLEEMLGLQLLYLYMMVVCCCLLAVQQCALAVEDLALPLAEAMLMHSALVPDNYNNI